MKKINEISTISAEYLRKLRLIFDIYIHIKLDALNFQKEKFIYVNIYNF